MKISGSIRAALAASVLLPTLATAQQLPVPQLSPSRLDPAGPRTLVASRITATAPTVDGRLDEAIWAHAQVATGFIEYEPTPGVPASERTEARVLVNERALYVGVRLFDSHPDSIVARLARRDEEVYSDWFYVAIDSYHDGRSGFAFGVNPAGVKVDVALFDDTNSDEGWDAVWDVATTVDSLGWLAEFRIPLSQLRFSADQNGNRVWGLQFKRTIARRNESFFWAPMPRDAQAVVSRFGDLTGLDGLTPPRHFEVQPYTLSRLRRAPAEAGDPFLTGTRWTGSLGADVKYGLTSNFTLTGTLNPDFGQVEADPSVVNLSPYETFFPEKRPFFQEGADIFRFGIGVGDGDLGNDQLFYSRRIGRTPQGNAPDAATFSAAPDATTILGATKLSGKTPGGWSVGVLDAVTASEKARWMADDGTRGTTVVEPLTNYAVARLSHDFRAGQSSVGGMLTAVDRRLDDASVRFLRSAAYVGGLNGRHRFDHGNYEVSGWVVGSYVRGDTSALRRTQESSTHYFQRPDADYLNFDPQRTSLTGWAANVQAQRIGGGHWRGGFIANIRSPGLEVNDLGYLRNTDQAMGVFYLGYEQYRPHGPFQRWDIYTNEWGGWNFGGDRTMTGFNLNGGFELRSNWGLNAGVERDLSALATSALRGGPAILGPAHTNGWLSAYTDHRRLLQAQLSINFSREADTGGRSLGIWPTLQVRPSQRTDLSLSPGVSWSHDPWQYVTQEAALGRQHYVFADLHQTTTSLTARLNYTLSPGLSLQFYAQPFLSAGQYTRFMEVASPRADRFGDRFQRYDAGQLVRAPNGDGYLIDLNRDGLTDLSIGPQDFNVREFRSNLVLRWEYRPGSTLFLVWSQGRSAPDDGAPFRFGPDARTLFAAPSSNMIMLKLSYWLGT